MWGWLKGLWSSKGSGGCIAVDGSGPATLTPLESKLSSRSSNGLKEDDTGNSTLQQLNRPPPLPQQDLDSLQPDSSRAPDQDGSSSSAELLPSAGRYIYSGGKPVGIANTVKRYHESRPLRPHLTPFEARLEAKIAEEEVAAAAVQQAGDAAGTGSTKKQLFGGR